MAGIDFLSFLKDHKTASAAASKPHIPTGFEGQQRALDRKDKIAELLMAQAFQSNPHMTSWAQPIAQMAQAWAGKSMMKKDDAAQGALDSQIQTSYLDKLGQFNTDAKTMTPAELTAKYSGEPMLAERLKPYTAAMQTQMGYDHELRQDGPTWRRNGDIRSGMPTTPDPTKQVILNPVTGRAELNPVAIGAARAAGGFGTEGYPQSVAWPGQSPQPQQQVPPVAGGMPTDPGMSAPDDQQKLYYQALAAHAMQQPGSGVPGPAPVTAPSGPPTHTAKDGRPLWFINGQYYDNPEGR